MSIDFLQVKYLLSNGLYRFLSLDGTKTVEEYLNADKSTSQVEPINLADWTIKVFGSLLLVVALLIAVLFILKKYMNQSNISMFDKKKAIEVLSSVSIGPKRSICIVKVESETLVLGVTPSTISFLTKLEQKETAKEEAVSDAIKTYSRQVPAENHVKSAVEELSAQKATVDAKAFDDVLKDVVDNTDDVKETPVINKEKTSGEESFNISKKSDALDGEKALMENLKKLRDYAD